MSFFAASYDYIRSTHLFLSRVLYTSSIYTNPFFPFPPTDSLFHQGFPQPVPSLHLPSSHDDSKLQLRMSLLQPLLKPRMNITRPHIPIPTHMYRYLKAPNTMVSIPNKAVLWRLKPSDQDASSSTTSESPHEHNQRPHRQSHLGDT